MNYGSALRQLLTDGLGGAALHVLDPAARPFEQPSQNRGGAACAGCAHAGRQDAMVGCPGSKIAGSCPEGELSAGSRWTVGLAPLRYVGEDCRFGSLL